MSSSASKAVLLWRYTSNSSSRATVEAAAAAAAHVSLVNALRCQLSLNKHSNAPANGRHTWLHFQQKSTPTPDTLTHVFTVALTFTSIFTSSLPSTRNVNSVDSTHLSELRSSRRAPHPNPSSNPQSQFQFQLPPSPSHSTNPFPLPLLAALSGPQIFTPC